MKARTKGNLPRTRFSTTLDTYCLERLKAVCEEQNLSVSMVLDALIADYIHGNTKNKGAEIIANMLAEPIIVNLVLEVILPEVKRKVGELEDVFKRTKENPE